MRLHAASILGLLALAACSSSNSTGNNGGNDSGPAPISDGSVDATTDGSSDAGSGLGPTARFSIPGGPTVPQFLDVPFPSDVYLANGKVMDPLPGLDAFVPSNSSYLSHAYGTMNGFSRVALSLFAVDDTSVPATAGVPTPAIIDPSSLPVAETDCQTATSSVYMLDLADGANPAILPCRAEFHNDQPAATSTPVIAAGPARGYLLQEGHPYAVVLTSRVKDTSGRGLLATQTMNAIAGGASGTAGDVTSKYLAPYVTAHSILAANLATDGAKIVAIAPYTTMAKTGELFAMREALESAPVPTLAWDSTTMAPMGATKFAKVATGGTLPIGFTASTDDWFGTATQKLPDGTDDPDAILPVIAHDQLAAVGTAVFSAASYLQVKPGGYDDMAHGTFQYDDAGVPVAQAPVKIWVTFGIPTTAMPAGGYPTVILQHGISSSRMDIMSLANVFATRGWMFAAIDSVTFGARAPEANLAVDAVNNFSGGGGAYKGPDGFADTDNGSVDFFGSLLNALAIGDQFREAGFDTAQLVKLLRSNPDLSPLAGATGGVTPKIDPTRIAYVGDSLGAMEGTIASAIEPRVSAWFLNVNGGSLMHELIAHSPRIGSVLASAGVLEFGITSNVFNWSNPYVSLLQQAVDPGDPIAYAPYLSTAPKTIAGVAPHARNIIQTEALFDESVTDEANEALARAAGWGLAVPNVGSNADLLDASAPGANPRKTPLANISPDDAGAIHDSPVVGSTAVVVQCSPCAHGLDLVSSQGEDDFAIPYQPPFVGLSPPLTFTEDYRSLQIMAGNFFNDAFNANVPKVVGITPPVRDR